MNIEILIAKIMNTAPYQLPPIIHGNGVYHIDIQYLGVVFNKTGVSLQEVMEAYFHFTTKTNFKKTSISDSITECPVRPGYSINYQSNKS